MAGGVAKGGEGAPVVAGHHGAGGGAFLAQDGGRQLLHLHFLDLDQQRHAGEGAHHLLEGGDADAGAAIRGGAGRAGEVPAGIEALELARGEGGERPRAVGGALEGGIVEDHRDAIAGAAEVELEGVGPLRERQAKALQRVLGRVRGGAPVADDEARGGIEERVHGAA